MPFLINFIKDKLLSAASGSVMPYLIPILIATNILFFGLWQFKAKDVKICIIQLQNCTKENTIKLKEIEYFSSAAEVVKKDKIDKSIKSIENIKTIKNLLTNKEQITCEDKIKNFLEAKYQGSIAIINK